MIVARFLKIRLVEVKGAPRRVISVRGGDGGGARCTRTPRRTQLQEGSAWKSPARQTTRGRALIY